MTPAERQRASRLARKQAGGGQCNFYLTPKAAAKLAQWTACGSPVTHILNGLLERSRPPISPRSG